MDKEDTGDKVRTRARVDFCLGRRIMPNSRDGGNSEKSRRRSRQTGGTLTKTGRTAGP